MCNRRSYKSAHKYLQWKTVNKKRNMAHSVILFLSNYEIMIINFGILEKIQKRLMSILSVKLINGNSLLLDTGAGA